MKQKDMIEKYFFSYVEKKNGCWLWTGPKTQRNWPLCHVSISEVCGITCAAALGIWVLEDEKKNTRGTRRTCGNRLCCNPDHIDYSFKKKGADEKEALKYETHIKQRLKNNKSYFKMNEFCKSKLLNDKYYLGNLKGA